MNTSNNNLLDHIKAKLELFKNWLFQHSRIIMPVVLLICVAATIIIAINANKRKAAAEEVVEGEVVDAAEGTDLSNSLISVPEVPLELDAVPEINELINAYFQARVDGDIDTMRRLRDKLDETEALREQATSQYLESFPRLEIYTKAGPKGNTYIVYVNYEAKFHDYEDSIPGMTSFYACQDENGNYYLTKAEDVDDDVKNYIRELSLQDDFVDLYNKVTAAYNDMVAENDALQQFILDLNEEIDKNVGEAMARANGSGPSTEGEEPESSDQPNEATHANAQQENIPDAVVTKVRATDVVNIRTSDSETADKLGKAAVGDEFALLEERGNGWSKVSYAGREAFIKSEYLEPSETAMANANGAEEEPQTQTDNGGSNEVTGTVTATASVRIRASASESAEKLGTAFIGQKLDLIMKQADGWTKIKYNGRTAYVKSDYVE